MNSKYEKNQKKSTTGARPNEIQVYALHLLQDNKLEDVMTYKCQTILNKNHILGITPPQNPMMDIQILLFKTPEDRNNCYKDLEEMGIKTAVELLAVYVDKKYLGEEQWKSVLN